MENTSEKIQSLVDSIKVLTVVEVATLVKELKSQLGIADMPIAAPVAQEGVAAAGAAPRADEGAAPKKVELIDGGPEKIKTIKALRKIKKDLGLTEAKTMVDSVPVVIAESVPAAEAKTMKEELEAAGAKVKIS